MKIEKSDDENLKFSLTGACQHIFWCGGFLDAVLEALEVAL
jgi:hypothetical protein